MTSSTDSIAIMIDNVLLGWTARENVEDVKRNFRIASKKAIVSIKVSSEGHELRVITEKGRQKKRRRDDVPPEWTASVQQSTPMFALDGKSNTKTLPSHTKKLITVIEDEGWKGKEQEKQVEHSKQTTTKKQKQQSNIPSRQKHDSLVGMTHRPLKSKTRSRRNKNSKRRTETFGLSERITSKGEKSFPCEDCEYTAGRRDHLKRHLLAIHNKVLIKSISSYKIGGLSKEHGAAAATRLAQTSANKTRPFPFPVPSSLPFPSSLPVQTSGFGTTLLPVSNAFQKEREWNHALMESYKHGISGHLLFFLDSYYHRLLLILLRHPHFH